MEGVEQYKPFPGFDKTDGAVEKIVKCISDSDDISVGGVIFSLKSRSFEEVAGCPSNPDHVATLRRKGMSIDVSKGYYFKDDDLKELSEPSVRIEIRACDGAYYAEKDFRVN